MVQQVEKQYGDLVTFVWIDIAHYQIQETEQLKEIMEEMKVQYIPALVLMDSQRQLIQTWQGSVERREVSKAIERLVK